MEHNNKNKNRSQEFETDYNTKDNPGLEKKLTEKQTPADSDKGGLSGKTSHSDDGGSQRANVSTNGNVDRSSVGELGTHQQRRKNQILNEQIKAKNDE